MAGKEWKAKERTVQKMSREGLVEENLRTGSRQKVKTQAGKRIGERPMEVRPGEEPAAAPVGSSGNIRDQRRYETRQIEPVRSVPERTDTGKVTSELRQTKRRRTDRRESSPMEAPSSLHEADAALDSAESEGSKREGAANSRRLKQSRYAPPRKERGNAETPASGKGRQRRPAGKKEDPGQAQKGFLKEPEMEEGEGSEDVSQETVSGQSRRMQHIRGHPSKSAKQAAYSASELRHTRQKKQVYDYAAQERKKESRFREGESLPSGLEGAKEEILTRQKKERLNQEQRKVKTSSRLSFDDGKGMVKGSGAGFKGRAGQLMEDTAASGMKTAFGAAGIAAHAKLSEVEDENAGTQAAHAAELSAEESVRSLASRGVRRQSRKAAATRRKAEEAGVSRLAFAKEEGTRTAKAAKIEADKKTTIKKFFQKQRQRRMYAVAKKEEKTVETILKTQQSLTVKAAVVVKEAFVRNSRVFLILGLMGVFFLLISASLTSCTALMQGAGSSVVGTTYPSTDEDIYAVENRYRELERALNAQINAMRSTHPEYDDFRYQIDEISHNPYHLISYFTTKYGEFTYDQVKDELEEIFREQYGLTTSGENNVTVTETKKVRVGESLGQVVTSGYCNCALCCGQWAGSPTASGAWPAAQHTIAVDASNPFVPMGTHVIMNGVEYVVEDTGAFARYGVQFDVYYDDHQTAQNHGHQTWEAYLADSNGGREIEVTTTQTVNRYSVSLTNHNLDSVLRNRLSDDEKVRYSLYNRTYGHRDYLFDLNSLPTYGGSGYTIPPEALSDERFARMIGEAEKHLGTPYVWGGYAPGGFDCSGFVSWVINHCGNGWDIGRQTAEGIRQHCAYVSPSDARPGDIIFFERTYDTPGASHVAIYVGNGMMIHCGKPVQYTTINTEYWQNHFMQFGRLP